MTVVIFSGRRRQAFHLLPGRAERRAYARDLRQFLFPSNSAYHKAKRRGERALAGSPVA